MGILKDGKQANPSSAKHKSTQLDFGKLAPLKKGGTLGFQGFRDHDGDSSGRHARKKSNGSAVGAMSDSDDDDDDIGVVGKLEDLDDKDVKQSLTAEDVQKSGELADGVRQIKVRSAWTVRYKSANFSAAQTPAFRCGS
jgi:hypothetical protein